MAPVVALRDRISTAVSAALTEVAGPALAATDPAVRRSERADFQSTVALVVAGRAGRPAPDIARDLAAALGPDASASGPGFVNVTIPDATIRDQIGRRLAADRLLPLAGQRVVLDYSAPNIAKEMHVGHLRSTVIGDALARILAHLGADVIRQNHIGDWGTQFGMLIQYVDEHPDLGPPADAELSRLEDLYRAARAAFESDAGFADRARRRVVALQSGDPATLAVWRDLVDESVRAFQAIYDRMGVSLTPADCAGESSYNHLLAGVAAELEAAGLARDSEGALCVFFDGITGPDGEPVPLMVRKSDGGFGYVATDLATIRHRIRDLKADRILYVVDARQALHFRMVFETARRAGWLSDGVSAVHVAFGTVLAADGRPFRTRAGDTVRLRELLDAAEARAREVAGSADHGPDPGVVRAVGIGAVKYGDLSTSRTKDYTFDVDRLVSYTGNTGMYLQYAHVRVCSILRKVPAGAGATLDPDEPLHPSERALALALDEFEAAVVEAADTLEPHRLCGYLYALAKAFTEFFENCPVLRAATDGQRGNRVALCELTRRTLATGLDLLGIEAPERA